MKQKYIIKICKNYKSLVNYVKHIKYNNNHLQEYNLVKNQKSNIIYF